MIPEDGFRGEVCALLWALGYAPQAHAFCRTAALPSRQLCRRLIYRSLDTMRMDTLVQHIWLSMRDRGPFDLRKHESLYAEMNVVYQPPGIDRMVLYFGSGDSPEKTFAQV